MNIAYCPACGAPTRLEIPPGDQRERAVCTACATIHYVNPKVVCGCLLICGDQILLARRSIEPRSGYWTLPAGFMEIGESTLEAACRECYEEALATPLAPALYGLISQPRIGQVYVMYRGNVAADAFGVGEESQEVRLFAVDELPWSDLAFPIVELTLRRYLRDQAAGHFPVFDVTISVRPGEPIPSSLISC